MKIVDLFAGPGGWDQGLTDLGFDGTVVGLELDKDACATASAAGHLRVQADVAQYPPSALGGFDGLIASPPCQAFSLAGKGAGFSVVDLLLEHVWACKDGWVDPSSVICSDDVRADLTLQPLRWADELRPEWMAFEQVPGVLPMWQSMAAVFERWGYSTATAVLNAADYGVPQTRKRAVLVASRTVPAQMPEPTHFDPRKGASLFGEPWVSMVDGLGWGLTVRPAPTVAAGHNGKGTGATWGGTGGRQTLYGAQDTPEWAHKRPATTVVGSFCPDIIAAPDYRTSVSRQDAPDSIRVTIAEAGILQSFPPGYPWQGSKTKRHEQVGNAIPPKLASVVLRPLVAPSLSVAA